MERCMMCSVWIVLWMLKAMRLHKLQETRAFHESIVKAFNPASLNQ